ncbi:MAG: histidine phosphatase family protein [Bacteroidota bacterium]
MMKLYFLRHGQTDYNLKQIVQGGGIDSDLNATGRAQAEAFYDAYQHLSFDSVYASTLKRTHQTLAPWQQNAGYQFIQEPGLKEFGWGVHEGKKPTPQEAANFQKILQRWANGDVYATVEQGETLHAAWQRAEPFIHSLPQKHQDQQVLICSHGRQLRILLCNLLQVELKEMERFKHDNTGLSVIHWHPDGRRELVTLNDTSHLSRLTV